MNYAVRTSLPGAEITHDVKTNVALDRTRRTIVRLVFIVYWLLIFEGALRKWVLPQAADALFFVRDPFVAGIYALSLRAKLFKRAPPQFWLLCGVALGFCVLAVLQGAILGTPLAVLAYGIRNYFLYAPLVFVIGKTFRQEDIDSLVRWTLVCAFPIALLAFAQFASPTDAWINQTYSSDAEIFTVVEGRVRAYGTFTFTAGQANFVGSVVALCLAVWSRPKDQRPLGRAALWGATFSTVANVAVSGSRTAFFFAGSAVLGAVAAGLLRRGAREKSRGVALPLIVVAGGAVLFVGLFSDAYQAMRERQKTAERIEGSTLTRAVRSVTSSADVFWGAPALGHGLGVGTNAGAKLTTGRVQFTLAEDEWTRVILECGPVAGSIYLGLRIVLFAFILRKAVTAARRHGDPLPLLLLSFAGLNLLAGAATMQGTINGYTWLFSGFAYAAALHPCARSARVPN